MLYELLSLDDLIILGAFVFGLLFIYSLRKKFPAPPRDDTPWLGEDDDDWRHDHWDHDHHVHSDDCDHHEFHDDCDHDD